LNINEPTTYKRELRHKQKYRDGTRGDMNVIFFKIIILKLLLLKLHTHTHTDTTL